MTETGQCSSFSFGSAHLDRSTNADGPLPRVDDSWIALVLLRNNVSSDLTALILCRGLRGRRSGSLSDSVCAHDRIAFSPYSLLPENLVSARWSSQGL